MFYVIVGKAFAENSRSTSLQRATLQRVSLSKNEMGEPRPNQVPRGYAADLLSKSDHSTPADS